MTARETLAARQRELVRALVAGAPVPPGFDVERIAAARRALLHKRMRQVEKRLPALAAELGADFAAKFTAFAAQHPPRSGAGSGRDADAFRRWARRVAGR